MLKLRVTAAADSINEFCAGCSSIQQSHHSREQMLLKFTLKCLSIFRKHKMVCVFQSRIYFSVVSRYRLEVNFFMKPDVISHCEGLGQNTTMFLFWQPSHFCNVFKLLRDWGICLKGSFWSSGGGLGTYTNSNWSFFSFILYRNKFRLLGTGLIMSKQRNRTFLLGVAK